MFDICVIGPITRDIIRIAGKPQKEMPGGVVYYASHTYRSLGLRTAVITKAVQQDADELLQELRQIGVQTYCRHSDSTTVFENVYKGGNLDCREQSVASVAAPFTSVDLADMEARAFHLGPLTESDMDPVFIEAVSRRGERVGLDVQGLLRKVVNGKVQPIDWAEKRAGLAYVDALKADLQEAQLLSGKEDPEQAAYQIAEFGPSEVIITLGSRGSLILAQGKLQRIPAYSPPQIVDATGCGDTYFAGYIFQRLKSGDVAAAGRFATAVAMLKLGHDGPFSGSERDAQSVLNKPLPG